MVPAEPDASARAALNSLRPQPITAVWNATCRRHRDGRRSAASLAVDQPRVEPPAPGTSSTAPRPCLHRNLGRINALSAVSGGWCHRFCLGTSLKSPDRPSPDQHRCTALAHPSSRVVPNAWRSASTANDLMSADDVGGFARLLVLVFRSPDRRGRSTRRDDGPHQAFHGRHRASGGPAPAPGAGRLFADAFAAARWLTGRDAACAPAGAARGWSSASFAALWSPGLRASPSLGSRGEPQRSHHPRPVSPAERAPSGSDGSSRSFHPSNSFSGSLLAGGPVLAGKARRCYQAIFLEDVGARHAAGVVRASLARRAPDAVLSVAHPDASGRRPWAGRCPNASLHGSEPGGLARVVNRRRSRAAVSLLGPSFRRGLITVTNSPPSSERSAYLRLVRAATTAPMFRSSQVLGTLPPVRHGSPTYRRARSDYVGGARSSSVAASTTSPCRRRRVMASEPWFCGSSAPTPRTCTFSRWPDLQPSSLARFWPLGARSSVFPQRCLPASARFSGYLRPQGSGRARRRAVVAWSVPGWAPTTLNRSPSRTAGPSAARSQSVRGRLVSSSSGRCRSFVQGRLRARPTPA